MTKHLADDPLGIHGTVIADKYRVDGLVGEGGFSVVYRAEHLIWKQPVALKCFKILANAPEGQREKLLEAFIQEGRLMASMSSRCAAIVQARDVGTFTTANGAWIPYIVLEWLEGQPLDLVLDAERRAGMPPRSLPEILALLGSAATALELVHGSGIAHRDIKPANFFVIGDARKPGAFVKVLDFGIAKVMAEHAQRATALAATGQEITAFTPNYGAPEQFSRTHGATGPWTDVFAMALVVVEMLLGRVVLEGDDYLQLAIASRDPARRPTPGSLGVPVVPAVEAVFQRALAVSPADRYPSMGAFWQALQQAASPESAYRPIPAGGAAVGGPAAPYAATAHSLRPASFPSGAGTGTQPQLGTGLPAGSGPNPHPAAPNATTGPASFPSGAPPAPGTVPLSQSTGQTGIGLSASAPVPARGGGKNGLVIAAVAAALGLAAGAVAVWKLGRSEPAPAAPPATPSAALVGPGPKGATSAAATATAAPARRTECPEGMVLVPGGRFFMGSDDPSFKLWQPAHKVTLDTFCIDVNEVTAEEYKACSDRGDCKRPDEIPNYPKSEGTTDAEHEKNRTAYAEHCNFGKPGREKHPINCVSWALADNYCKVMGKRLPTEAEWEYAARGSDGRKFPWGDEHGDHEHMNACGPECNAWERSKGLRLSPTMYTTDDGWAGTAPVGSYPKGKTRFGANDFVGNVWEWTADWFEIYKPDEVVNPTGAPAGDRKAIRGGGFNGGVHLWLNPAFRYHQIATATTPAIGFRCAMNL